MKDVKRRLETFSFYDRWGLEAHLARMAAQGWLLEKIGQFLWTYRRIEPKTLTFSVCYFPKASTFDPGPSEEQETFYDFCAHTGWVLAAASAQLQVFYNERQDPVPIETDPALEVETIHRTMKRSVLPSNLVLLAMALLSAGLFVWRLIEDPVGVLASPANLFTGFCWLEVILLVGVELVSYTHWHRKAALAAERGEFLRTGSHRKLQIAALVLLGVGTVYYGLSIAFSGDRMMVVTAVLMLCVYLPGLFLLVRGIKGLLKRKKVSAKVNRVVTFAAAFVAAYAIVGGILFVVLFGSSHGWLAGNDEQVYEHRGQTFTARSDQLLLTVEDLADVDFAGYTRELRTSESLFLAQYDAVQRPRFDAEHYREMPRLEYTVTAVKASFLYDLCKNSLLHRREERWNRNMPEEDWYFYEPVDAAPWGAEEAYCWTSRMYGPGNDFLLCWPDRIVEIEFDPDWQLTPAQMSLVGERLGAA